jgi:hypothetical protein
MSEDRDQRLDEAAGGGNRRRCVLDARRRAAVGGILGRGRAAHLHAVERARAGGLGLKDREAYVTRGVRLIPMFTGFPALAALLALMAMAWWREGR